jgi:hypothetical protein
MSLSPAAQAVMKATEATDGTYLAVVAAAFRTAVEGLAYSDYEGRQFIYVPELLEIANELSPEQ